MLRRSSYDVRRSVVALACERAVGGSGLVGVYPDAAIEALRHGFNADRTAILNGLADREQSFDDAYFTNGKAGTKPPPSS